MDVTIEQAIKSLSAYIDNEAYTDKFQNVCKLAIEVLEKQIAKEPVVVTIRNVDYQKCPVCGRVLFGKEYYCASCGQRVNRGE